MLFSLMSPTFGTGSGAIIWPVTIGTLTFLGVGEAFVLLSAIHILLEEMADHEDSVAGVFHSAWSSGEAFLASPRLSRSFVHIIIYISFHNGAQFARSSLYQNRRTSRPSDWWCSLALHSALQHLPVRQSYGPLCQFLSLGLCSLCFYLLSALLLISPCPIHANHQACRHNPEIYQAS